MIVQMAKVLLSGPKELFLEVLTSVQRQGAIHIDPAPDLQNPAALEKYYKSLTLEEDIVQERAFLEKLLQQTSRLLALLPAASLRPSFISPESALQFVPKIIASHEKRCQEWMSARQSASHKLRELEEYHRFLQAVFALVPDTAGFAALEVTGIKIADLAAFKELERYLQAELAGFIESRLVEDRGGESFALLVTEKDAAARLREILGGHQVAELACPDDDLTRLPLTEKPAAVARRKAEYEKELNATAQKLARFARQWGGIYRNLQVWLGERLAVLHASTQLFETERCFLIFGWMPVRQVAPLHQQLAVDFAGKVLLEEIEVRGHDLERIPIVLQNRGYFQPFELFSRLLPLPNYTSFDITPFIAIFFPVFFGMMLGDIGYGLVIAAGALVLYYSSKTKKDLNDAAKILVVASCYTMVFGLFYGEFFGAFGQRYFGLHPFFFERKTALMPMLIFSVSLGVVHVLIGLVLGMLTALKKQMRQEALFRFFSILIIFCLLAGAWIYGSETLTHLRRPIQGALLIIILVLLVTGGLLAPLEVLKHFGSIISYARIMAIGLTSVLLAEVASQLAGMMGSIWLGLFVAFLLHAFNIMLGIFAPTIHALRLHYVEFFSKFMESRGPAFHPLKKIK